MKLFEDFALVLLFIGTLASYDGVDATYREFIEEGPTIYIGKVDSLKAYTGRNRAMFERQRLLGPRTKAARIFWENRTGSAELQLTDKVGLTQVIVKDLAEGLYVFRVCTYDIHDNSSIMSEVPYTVYGDACEKLSFNTRVKMVVLKNDALTTTFTTLLEPTPFGSEITHTSIDGKDKMVILKAPETQTKIDDLAGDRIIYRLVCLPGETATDYFYSESGEFEIK